MAAFMLTLSFLLYRRAATGHNLRNHSLDNCPAIDKQRLLVL
jgi:hypothetical protein